MKHRLLATALAAATAAALFAFTGTAAAVTPQIASGGDHTCALENTGVVKCFGYNTYGELGVATNTGTANANPTPTTVDFGTTARATQIAAGLHHTCVLFENGTVKCFGLNDHGQLGITTNSGTPNANPTPTTVDFGTTAKPTQLSAGNYQTCALFDDDTVECFGANRYGQLGTTTNNNNETANPTPTAIDFGTTAKPTEVSAGSNHTCVRFDDATVKCFGHNYYGELGTSTNNYSDTANPTPTTIDFGTAAKPTEVVAKGYRTCVLFDDSTVRCFGNNDFGQLGSATNNSSGNPNPTPTTIDFGITAKPTHISAGAYHTCVLFDDGTLRCFGYNFYGELGTTTGNGSYDPNPTPTTVVFAGSGKPIQASGGEFHTCALLGDGTVECFGNNNYGQLGTTTNNGTGDATPSPAPVPGLANMTVPATPVTPAVPTGPASPQPSTAAPLIVAAKLSPYHWHARRRGRSYRLYGWVFVKGNGVGALNCQGKLRTRASLKRRHARTAKSSSNKATSKLAWKSGHCRARVSFHMRVSRKLTSRKAKLTFTLINSSTFVTKSKTKTVKLPR